MIQFGRIFASTREKHSSRKKRKTPYTYVIKDDYIVINNNIKRGRITKEMLESALSIENPIPSKIGGWAPSYICGIITDYRII